MTREEAIKILDEVIPPPEHHTVDLDHLRIAQAWAYIKEVLTAEPKHGRWEGDTCSVCGFSWCDVTYEAPQAEMSFCPNCGARMDEVEK